MELQNNRTNRVKRYIEYTYTTRKLRGGLINYNINTNTLTIELDYASMESSPTHSKNID